MCRVIEDIGEQISQCLGWHCEKGFHKGKLVKRLCLKGSHSEKSRGWQWGPVLAFKVSTLIVGGH